MLLAEVSISSDNKRLPAGRAAAPRVDHAPPSGRNKAVKTSKKDERPSFFGHAKGLPRNPYTLNSLISLARVKPSSHNTSKTGLWDPLYYHARRLHIKTPFESHQTFADGVGTIMFSLDIMKMKETLEKCPECVSVEMKKEKIFGDYCDVLVAIIRSPITDVDKWCLTEEMLSFIKARYSFSNGMELNPEWITDMSGVIQEHRYLIAENWIRRDIGYKPNNAFCCPYIDGPFAIEFYHAIQDGDCIRAVNAMVCETRSFVIEDAVVLDCYLNWRHSMECENERNLRKVEEFLKIVEMSSV